MRLQSTFSFLAHDMKNYLDDIYMYVYIIKTLKKLNYSTPAIQVNEVINEYMHKTMPSVMQ